MLTHIAVSYRFQHQIHAVQRRSNLEGFDFMGLFQQLGTEEAKPRTKAETIDLLRKEGEIWANFMGGLSEDFLGQIVQFPKGATPPAKSRLEMIISVKEHEMHHRGQLFLIERIIGIVPHLTREMQARMAQAQTQSQAAKP